MSDTFRASGTRRELHARLAEALTSDDDLEALVEFLRDDLAYAPTNHSIIGSVLRVSEFETWQELMTGVRWDVAWPINYDTDEVREISSKLLTEMERS